MIKIKNAFLFMLMIFATFVLAACSGGSADLKDAALESVLPADGSFVMVVDYSNPDQIKAFQDIKELFPETGLVDKLIGFINEEGLGHKVSYEKDLEPFLEDTWKLGVSMVMPENFDFNNPDLNNFDDFGVYIAAEFGQADDFEDFLDVLFEEFYEDAVDYNKEGGVKYWTNVADDFYLARYGDVFVVTNTDQNRRAAIKRIEDGTGLDSNSEFAAKIEGIEPLNLGYFYFNGSFFSKFMTDFYASAGMPDLAASLKGMEDIYMVWFAESDGIMALSRATVSDISAFKEFFPEDGYEFTLIEDVNGDGLIAYSEYANLDPFLQSFLEGFAAGYNSVDGGNMNGKDLYKKLLGELASLSGAGENDIAEILSSPFAFVVSDPGGMIPTMSFYVKVGEDKALSARQLSTSIDVYVDKMIVEFDTLVESFGGFDAGLLKKDIEVVNGGALHKLYIDWGSASESTLANIGLIGLDAEDLKIELYYGVTGDGVFVVAFYPDFHKDYGKNVIAEREDFREGLSRFSGDSTAYVSYFSPIPLLDLAGRYLEVARNMGFLLDEDVRNFDLYGRQFAGTLKYIMSANIYSEKELTGKAYMRFETVSE